MFLELNPLVKPDLGLVIWMTLTFFIVLFVLAKYAWKPILKAVKTREDNIDNAISQATTAQYWGAESNNRTLSRT